MGKSLNEPIALSGQIVMNSREELDLAFKELKENTFIKQTIEYITELVETKNPTLIYKRIFTNMPFFSGNFLL